MAPENATFLQGATGALLPAEPLAIDVDLVEKDIDAALQLASAAAAATSPSPGGVPPPPMVGPSAASNLAASAAAVASHAAATDAVCQAAAAASASQAAAAAVAAAGLAAFGRLRRVKPRDSPYGNTLEEGQDIANSAEAVLAAIEESSSLGCFSANLTPAPE